MLKPNHKQWLSPFTAVTFIAVAVSGIFLLFHQKIAGMHQIHEWGGILFLLAGLLHAAMNWRSLISYFSNKRAVLGAGAGVVCIVVLITFFPLSQHGGKDQGNRHGARHGYYSTH